MRSAGSESGEIEAFDLRDGTLVASHRVAQDTVNGFSFHPCLPLAAVASGKGWEKFYFAPCFPLLQRVSAYNKLSLSGKALGFSPLCLRLA